jgi:hypothetical protein
MSNKRERVRRERWEATIRLLVAECKDGSERSLTYWAQQLAFGPVLVHALDLWLRHAEVDPETSNELGAVLRLARQGLGILPERAGTAERDVARLAARQATALSRGRRRLLERLLERLGCRSEKLETEVPGRMLRPYPLIGWSPAQPQ